MTGQQTIALAAAQSGGGSSGGQPSRPRKRPTPHYQKSAVLARIDAGDEVKPAEVETELDRLTTLLGRFRKGKLRLHDSDRKQLCDDQRRLEAFTELRRATVRAERAERRDQRFREALGVGLAQIEEPALMLGCLIHLLKWKVSQRDLNADEDLKTALEAAEMCLLQEHKRQKRATAAAASGG